MIKQRNAEMHKYSIESVLNALRNVPPTLNGFQVDADTLVDIFILRTLNSFEVCTFYPRVPEVTDPIVLQWFESQTVATRLLWKTVKIPTKHAGTEVSYIRQGDSVWLFYII